jgi:hypothetical protein
MQRVRQPNSIVRERISYTAVRVPIPSLALRGERWDEFPTTLNVLLDPPSANTRMYWLDSCTWKWTARVRVGASFVYFFEHFGCPHPIPPPATRGGDLKESALGNLPRARVGFHKPEKILELAKIIIEHA